MSSVHRSALRYRVKVAAKTNRISKIWAGHIQYQIDKKKKEKEEKKENV